jgi:hypothetical protein
VWRDAVSGELWLTTDPVPPTSEELSTWLEHPVVEVDGDRLLE